MGKKVCLTVLVEENAVSFYAEKYQPLKWVVKELIAASKIRRDQIDYRTAYWRVVTGLDNNQAKNLADYLAGMLKRDGWLPQDFKNAASGQWFIKEM